MRTYKNYRMVLDLLKPHEPSIVELAEELGKLEGVSKVNVTVLEVDAETETIKLVIEGKGLSFERLNERIRDMGAVIHSVDEITVENFEEK